MGMWKLIPDNPGKQGREAGSSSALPIAIYFSIASGIRLYVKVEVCQHYWETSTPLPWSDAHLLNGWHLSPDRVRVSTIPTSIRARLLEINRLRVVLPPDFVDDARYVVDSSLWDTWFQDDHNMRQ
ncbi:hypothetical protein D1007_38058 [Hordeum vulgare]|nr:hypothetical protein D1007_38058 [Hordeum vulgare]